MLIPSVLEKVSACKLCCYTSFHVRSGKEDENEQYPKLIEPGMAFFSFEENRAHAHGRLHLVAHY